MTNQKIADTLEQLADLLEFTGTNPFRLRAYRNAARKISGSGDTPIPAGKDETLEKTPAVLSICFTGKFWRKASDSSR